SMRSIGTIRRAGTCPPRPSRAPRSRTATRRSPAPRQAPARPRAPRTTRTRTSARNRRPTMSFDWGLFRQAKLAELANQTRNSMAEAGLQNAQAGLVGQQAQVVLPAADAARRLAMAQTMTEGQRARQIGAEATGLDLNNSVVNDDTLGLLHRALQQKQLLQNNQGLDFGYGLGRGETAYSHGTDFTSQPDEQHYIDGARRVPGKGDGTVDKVHAMLAPGEAVLTKTAAEMMGRDKIAALNAHANAKDEAAGIRAPQGSAV